jgi:hypothetical protein
MNLPAVSLLEGRLVGVIRPPGTGTAPKVLPVPTIPVNTERLRNKILRSIMFAWNVHQTKAERFRQVKPFCEYMSLLKIALASATDWAPGRQAYYDPSLEHFYYNTRKPWETEWLNKRRANRDAENKRAKAAGTMPNVLTYKRLVTIEVAMRLPDGTMEPLSADRRPLIYLSELLTGKLHIVK